MRKPFLGCIIALLATACTNEPVNTTATYTGHVIEASDNTPFVNLPVKVTNGENVHTSVLTDSEGAFKFTIVIKEIDASYYVEIGDETCKKKKVDIPGFASGVTDMGTITVQGPELPSMSLLGTKVYGNVLRINANISYSGRLPIIERGVCFGKNASPTVDDQTINCGNGDGTFGCEINLKELDRNSTFYFRAYAKNNKGVAYTTEVKNSTDSGLPSIDNGRTRTSNVTATSANIYSSVSSNGGYDILEVGVCWDTNGNPSIEGNHKSTNGSSSFSIQIDGLSPSTKYYYYAYARNVNGVAYSQQGSFTTRNGLPSVLTNQPSATVNSILISGTAQDDGGFPITQRGICYSTITNDPTTSDLRIDSGNGIGSFNVTIPGLTANTEYFLRAYASNQNGTSYGKSRRISTTNGLPVVKTQDNYDCGVDYLVISGTSSAENSSPILRQGICWSSKTNPSLSDNIVEANTKNSPFSCRIEGLHSGTTYYCCTFAENKYGVAYGSSYAFTTEYEPTALMGYVYDQDNRPIPDAEVSGYDVYGYNSKTDKNGFYSITLGKRMHGEYRFFASANGYNQKIEIINIARGMENHLDFHLTISNSFAVDFGDNTFHYPGSAWEMMFECRQSSLAGNNTTRNIRIQNFRSVPVTWEITNLPSVGISFSPVKGTIEANGETNISVTFTYPSTSSTKMQISGCNSGSRAYVWNWEYTAGGYYAINGNVYENSCSACCYHNPYIRVDNYSEAFTVMFNQFVIYK